MGRCGGRERGCLFLFRRDKRLGRQRRTGEGDLGPARKQVGHAPESVECPENLKGEVGATTRCTLNDSGETYGVDVNVTKVEGTDVKFDLKVNDKPS